MCPACIASAAWAVAGSPQRRTRRARCEEAAAQRSGARNLCATKSKEKSHDQEHDRKSGGSRAAWMPAQGGLLKEGITRARDALKRAPQYRGGDRQGVHLRGTERQGEVLDLFEERAAIVLQFMRPPGRRAARLLILVENIGHSRTARADTSLVLVLARTVARSSFKAHGLDVAWYSAFGSDFNKTHVRRRGRHPTKQYPDKGRSSARRDLAPRRQPAWASYCATEPHFHAYRRTGPPDRMIGTYNWRFSHRSARRGQPAGMFGPYHDRYGATATTVSTLVPRSQKAHPQTVHYDSERPRKPGLICAETGWSRCQRRMRRAYEGLGVHRRHQKERPLTMQSPVAAAFAITLRVRRAGFDHDGPSRKQGAVRRYYVIERGINEASGCLEDQAHGLGASRGGRSRRTHGRYARSGRRSG